MEGSERTILTGMFALLTIADLVSTPGFGQLFAVLATGLGSTIGVCVYLIRQQAAERDRWQKRADERTDQMLQWMQNQQTELLEVQREMRQTLEDLTSGIAKLTDRIHEVERRR